MSTIYDNITFRKGTGSSAVSYTLPRPPEFAPQREDIYAGVYTTCNGETRADKVGWKYSDMTLAWDALYQDDVEKLFNLNGNEIYLIFDDPSGSSITEQIIRNSVVSMRHRFTVNNKHWWKGVSIDISFVGTHTD